MGFSCLQMNIKKLYQLFREYPKVSIDSRNIEKGSIFFALRGQNFDGNKYASEALEKGAAYAVVDDEKYLLDSRTILVENVLKCLQELANFHRKQVNIPVLAITGTNGKTTTKELIAAILSQNYEVTFTQGNLNNHIGVPLTLLNINSKTEIAVIEMGANHPGDIEELCKIAEPDLGLVTNIGKAHLEGFGSFEGVINTKSELYKYLREHTRKCFVNIDHEILIKQASGLEQLTYGTSDKAQLYGNNVGSSVFLTVRVFFPKGWLYLKSNLIGNYNMENVLAAARVGVYFEVDALKIQKAVELYKPNNNRSQLIEKGNNKIVMDAYNANPTSMLEALSNFTQIDHTGKVLILGDMLELGEYSNVEHQKIVDYILNNPFTEIYLVGKCFGKTQSGSKIKKFENTELLYDYLYQQKKMNNKLILIKGSRGIHLEQILDVFQ